ncbi:hypothetical protein ACI2JA_03940 [Alkalihalobacillus sp. NPDC078783]
MNVHNFERRGKKVKYFYHTECKAIKDNKDLVSSKPLSNETKIHSKSKLGLHEAIVKNNCELVDQFKNAHKLIGNYSSTEFPVYVEYDQLPYFDKSSCDSCITKCLGENNNHVNNGEKIKIDTYKRTIEGEHHKEHPCNRCVFNKDLTHIVIFDIAFADKGRVTDAIEVKKSSGVSKRKLVYCIKNNIRLYEVDVDQEIIDRKSRKVNCHLIWWRENEKLMIAERYTKYFNGRST